MCNKEDKGMKDGSVDSEDEKQLDHSWARVVNEEEREGGHIERREEGWEGGRRRASEEIRRRRGGNGRGGGGAVLRVLKVEGGGEIKSRISSL